MEISLIFLFFACAVVLILLAKIFQAKLIMMGAFLLLLFLALSIWGSGYEIAGTSTESSFRYTLNDTTNTNDLTQMQLNRSQVLYPQQNDFTRMLGAVLFLIAIIIGLLGAFG